MALEDDSDTLTTTPLKPAGAPLPAQIKTALPSVAPRLASAGSIVPVPAPVVAPQAAPAQTQVQPDSWDTMMQRFMGASRAHESGGNDQVVNKATGATGRYQFLPSTWSAVIQSHPELGLTPQDIYNGDKQDLALRAFAADNAKVLQKSGIAVNPANLFMMSFMGTGGGPAFIKQMEQTPGAGAAAIFPKEAKYNPGVFYTPEGRQRTLGEVYQLMTKSFGGQGPVAGPQLQFAANDTGVRSDATVDASPAEELPPAIAAAQQKLNSVTPAPMAAPVAPIAAAPAAPGGEELPDAIRKAQEALNPAALPTPAASTSPNPFLTDPKTEPSNPGVGEVMGVNPVTGAPIFADPKQEEEVLKGESDAAKGAASGVAQDVTGIGEWLPGSPGAAAARGTKYLEGVGDPTAQIIGRNAPLFAPLGEAFAAAKLGAKAVSEGLPVAEDLGAQLWSGMKIGAKSGAIAGATSPTGEEDTGKRYARKAGYLASETAIGAAGGAALPGVVGLAKYLNSNLVDLGKTLAGSYGKAAQKAAEELKSGVNARTGEVLKADEIAARDATIQKEVETKKLAEHDAEISRIEKAQTELAGRETKRGAEGRDVRQADDAAAISKFKQDVTTRARENVAEAEAQAKRAGASTERSRGYAVEQQQKALEAQESADAIAKQVADSPKMSREDFGKLVQDTAARTQEKYEKAREDAAQFKEAMDSAPKGAIVDTSSVLSKLTQIERSTADESLKGVIAQARRNLTTPHIQADGTTALRPRIALANADSLRKVLNQAISSGEMTLQGQVSAKTSAIVHNLLQVRDLVQSAAGAAHPPYAQAIKAWADNSRGPLDEFLPKTVGAKITQEQAFSGQMQMNAGRVTATILNDVRQGGGALGLLARENPEIVAATDKYLMRELTGGDGQKKLTPAVVSNFIDRNKSALDSLGLTSKYEQIRDNLAGAQKGVETAKARVEKMGDVVAGREAKQKALEDVVKQRQSIRDISKSDTQSERAQRPEGSLAPAASALKTPEDVAKEAATRGKEAEGRLKESAATVQAAKSETEGKIKDLASGAAKADAARHALNTLEINLNNAKDNKEVIAASDAIMDQLRQRGIFSDEEYDRVLKQVKDAAVKEQKFQKAASLAHQIIRAALVGVTGGLGFETERFIAHRISP